MSNKLFQSVIGQYIGSVDRIFGITDEDGTVIACSDPKGPTELRLPGQSDRLMIGITGLYISAGFTLRPMSANAKAQSNYTVFVEGTDKTADTVSALLAVSFANMKKLYDDRYDRPTFIKNIIQDNVRQDEIPARARELHIAVNEPKTVFIIRTETPWDTGTADILSNMFPDKQRDFIFPVGEYDTVLVKSIRTGYDSESSRDTAVRISDTFSTELFTKVKIGISSQVDSLKALPAAYREAHIAMDVCGVFGGDRNISEYERLGLGRLLYMLPTPLCEKYLEEVFTKEGISSLEPEILTTIQAFFENSLNVSETSRKLFIHRNTLVYRLDKIQKQTGLDLRNFDDAITFRVALMVNRYLDSKNQKTKQ